MELVAPATDDLALVEVHGPARRREVKHVHVRVCCPVVLAEQDALLREAALVTLAHHVRLHVDRRLDLPTLQLLLGLLGCWRLRAREALVNHALLDEGRPTHAAAATAGASVVATARKVRALARVSTHGGCQWLRVLRVE